MTAHHIVFVIFLRSIVLCCYVAAVPIGPLNHNITRTQQTIERTINGAEVSKILLAYSVIRKSQHKPLYEVHCLSTDCCYLSLVTKLRNSIYVQLLDIFRNIFRELHLSLLTRPQARARPKVKFSLEPTQHHRSLGTAPIPMRLPQECAALLV